MLSGGTRLEKEHLWPELYLTDVADSPKGSREKNGDIIFFFLRYKETMLENYNLIKKNRNNQISWQDKLKLWTE